MHYIGIDIGSTATKTVIMDENKKTFFIKIVYPADGTARKREKLS
ncbi:hypothetical protein [Treponema putidum]|nr:hypothetical protein [Treponema putidum]